MRPPPPNPPLAEATTVFRARTHRELLALVEEWRELATSVAEPNVFYEPCLFLPAFGELAREHRIHTLFVRDGAGTLIALFPLEWRVCSTSVPAPHFVMWKHKYCFLCTPLLRRGREPLAVAALSEWLASAGPSGALLQLGPHATDGPFDRALCASAQQRGDQLQTTRLYERALVRPTGNHPEYFSATVSRRRRKLLRRLRNRLDERGLVAFRTFTTPTEVHQWLPRFIALEHSGWKGREGTSFQSTTADRRFLIAAMEAAADRGQVEIRALFLDELPIAMTLTLLTGAGAFAFKIAYDEAHAAWSPGVQLDLEMFREIFANPSIQWVDSCADPNVPMSDSQWGERLSVRLAQLSRETPSGKVLRWSAAKIQWVTATARARIETLDPAVQQRLRRFHRKLPG